MNRFQKQILQDKQKLENISYKDNSFKLLKNDEINGNQNFPKTYAVSRIFRIGNTTIKYFNLLTNFFLRLKETMEDVNNIKDALEKTRVS